MEGRSEGAKISAIKAREILDSKGRPMVEVDVWTANGSLGRGSSPCGTSVGRHEASVLRDGGKRFGGLGVKKAVQNVTEVISNALIGRNVNDQRTIDKLMIELDGTPDKSHLGVNAIYSVSIAVARAAAHSLGLPLYRYLGGAGVHSLPVPMFNMINGGPYSDTQVEFQEFSMIPTGAESYSEALRMGVEVFSQVPKKIEERYGRQSVHAGHSGGYAAPVNEPAQLFEILMEAAEAAGYGNMFAFHLDCAASHFYDRTHGFYHFKGKEVGREEMIQFLHGLAHSYPLFMIEDPLDEDDFEGYAEMMKGLSIFVAGDDLFVTNMERLKKGISLGAANAMVFKPNMTGTLSEALDTVYYAKAHGYSIVPSSRVGGSIDDPIPDIAVAISAPLVKFGAPRTGERTNYQNRLLRIEEELGESAQFFSLRTLKR